MSGSPTSASRADPATWQRSLLTLDGPVVHRFAEVFDADWREGRRHAGPGRPRRGRPGRAGRARGPVRRLRARPGARRAARRAGPRDPRRPPPDLDRDALFPADRPAPARADDRGPPRARRAAADPGHARTSGSRISPAAPTCAISTRPACRILRYAPRMMHAKAVVLDDLAIVGSANIDVRSMLLNFETALVLYDRARVARGRALVRGPRGAMCGRRAPASGRCAASPRPTFRLGAPIL